MVKKLLSILVVALLAFYPSVSFAEGEDAASPASPFPKIVYSENNVSVSSDGQNWLAAHSEMSVAEGSHIKTAEASYCDVALDKSLKNIISLGPNSDIVVGEALKQVKISKGRVFAELKALPAGSQFEVVTPQAIAGVRGTAWESIVDMITQFVVQDNSIFVQGIGSEGQVTGENDVPAGSSITVNEQGLLGAVAMAAQADLNRMDSWSDRIEHSVGTYQQEHPNETIENYDGQTSNLYEKVMEEEMAGEESSFAAFDEDTLFIQTDFEDGIGNDITQSTFSGRGSPLVFDSPIPTPPSVSVTDSRTPPFPTPTNCHCPATNPQCQC